MNGTRFGRKRILAGLKLFLAVTLLAILLSSVDQQQLFETLKAVDKTWAIICVVVGYFVILFQDMVLGVIASPFARIPRLKLLSFNLVGRFFSLFFPSSVAGDFIKGYYLYPYFSRPAYVYAAMAVHRFLGGLATLMVALVASLVFLPSRLQGPSILLAVGLAIAGLLMGLVYFQFGEQVRTALIRHRDKRDDSKLFRTMYALLGAISSYRHYPGVVAKGFMLALLATQVVVGMYLVLAYALSIPLSYSQALVAASVTSLAVLVPVTPGSLGVTEGAFVVVAGVMGVSAENALSIVIFGRLIGYVCTIPGGIIYAVVRRDQPPFTTAT